MTSKVLLRILQIRTDTRIVSDIKILTASITAAVPMRSVSTRENLPCCSRSTTINVALDLLQSMLL